MKIKSFEIDHDNLEKGFYFSGENHNVFTYDLRMKKPNDGDYLQNGVMHTIEHLFAAYIRNLSPIKDAVIYFGPMGCRTGFYLLLYGIEREKALQVTLNCLKNIDFSSIPGAARKECGNYLEHDLKGAKKEIKEYIKVLEQL